MRNRMNLNGIWDFTFLEQEFDGRIPAGLKYESALSVPGCFDVTAPWFGKRGVGFYRRKVYAGGPVQLSIDGLGIAGEIFWDGKNVGSCPYAIRESQFTTPKKGKK